MTYLVCWITKLDKPNKEGISEIQHYKVFDEPSIAVELYVQLSLNKNVIDLRLLEPSKIEIPDKTSESGV